MIHKAQFCDQQSIDSVLTLSQRLLVKRAYRYKWNLRKDEIIVIRLEIMCYMI